MLFHFQTMIAELTGMAVANASLLDEATAAAEAMAMAHRALRGRRATMLVADDCHPQTLDVLDTRAEPLGIRIERLAPDALATRCEGGRHGRRVRGARAVPGHARPAAAR